MCTWHDSWWFLWYLKQSSKSEQHDAGVMPCLRSVLMENGNFYVFKQSWGCHVDAQIQTQSCQVKYSTYMECMRPSSKTCTSHYYLCLVYTSPVLVFHHGFSENGTKLTHILLYMILCVDEKEVEMLVASTMRALKMPRLADDWCKSCSQIYYRNACAMAMNDRTLCVPIPEGGSSQYR